nr:MAG TPA: hypothetical protein [Caudoviricetes sp.]
MAVIYSTAGGLIATDVVRSVILPLGTLPLLETVAVLSG